MRLKTLNGWKRLTPAGKFWAAYFTLAGLAIFAFQHFFWR